MGRIWNSFVIAFSMYSRIPMPRAQWTEDNLRYAMCFFPLIGAVIGTAELLFFLACRRLGAGEIFISCGLTVIPLLLTGGIHLDGYLDVTDAIHSYGSREKKLEIMKDPHCGAFALIGLGVYLLLYMGGISLLSESSIWLLPGVFVMERALSGFSVALFSTAKKEGLVAAFSQAAEKRGVCGALGLCFLVSLAWLLLLGGIAGGLCVLGALLTFWRYRRRAFREFGGITGDLAGHFLQCCERNLILLLALWELAARNGFFGMRI